MKIVFFLTFFNLHVPKNRCIFAASNKEVKGLHLIKATYIKNIKN